MGISVLIRGTAVKGRGIDFLYLSVTALASVFDYPHLMDTLRGRLVRGLYDGSGVASLISSVPISIRFLTCCLPGIEEDGGAWAAIGVDSS